MMEIILRAKNKTDSIVASLTMTGPFFDINSVLGQFKVLVAPSDADKFEAEIVGLLKPGNRATNNLSERLQQRDEPEQADSSTAVSLEGGELLSEKDAMTIAKRFAPKAVR